MKEFMDLTDGKTLGLTRGKDLDEKRKDSKKARKRLIFQIF